MSTAHSAGYFMKAFLLYPRLNRVELLHKITWTLRTIAKAKNNLANNNEFELFEEEQQRTSVSYGHDMQIYARHSD